MVARVYGSEAWYVEEEGYAERVACLYEGSSRGRHTVTFIVARMTGEDRWARRRAERNETDEGGPDEAGSGQADGQAEGQTTVRSSISIFPRRKKMASVFGGSRPTLAPHAPSKAKIRPLF